MMQPHNHEKSQVASSGDVQDAFSQIHLPGNTGLLEKPVRDVMTLFQTLLPGTESATLITAVPDNGIDLVCNADTCSESVVTLAQIVAMATGESVRIQNTAGVQTIDPPRVPLRMPGALRDAFTDSSIVQETSLQLLSMVGPLPDHLECDRSAVSRDLKNVIDRFPFVRPGVSEQEVIFTVEIHNDMSVLLEDWFPEMLKDLEKVDKKHPGAAIRIAIVHDDSDLYRIFNREFGSLDPFRLSCSYDQDLVVASVNKKSRSISLAPFVDKLSTRYKALTGRTLLIDITAPTVDVEKKRSFVVEPRRDWRGVSLEEAEREFDKLAREVPAVLGIQKVWREKNGNRFYVEHSVNGYPDAFFALVVSALSDYSFPIEFRSTEVPLSNDQVREALQAMGRYFPLVKPKFTVRSNSLSVQIHNDLEDTTQDWYQTFEQSLEVLADHADRKVMFSRRLRNEQIYNLVANHAGDYPWEVRSDEEMRSLEVEIPSTVPAPEAQQLEAELKRRSGWTVRIIQEDQESYNEIRLKGEEYRGVEHENARRITHYVRENIPKGLGESTVELRGNRIFVSYGNKHLPAPYLSWVRERFTRFRLPIVLQESEQASFVSSPDQARQIIEKSCPEGWWLRTLSHDKRGFSIRVFCDEASSEEQKQFEATIENALEGYTRISVEKVSNEMSELLRETGGESAHFLASLSSKSGAILSPGTARSVFDARFRPPVQGVGLSEPLFLKRRDLSQIFGMTIDQSNSRMLEDMVSIRKLPNENYLLGVHVVDASAYFPFGSLIDSVARERVRTMYGSRMVVPMVPEEIGLDKGTLQPHRSVPAISLFAEINSEGEVSYYRFYRSVVQSKRRLSYDRVEEMLKGAPGDEVRQVKWLSEVEGLLSSKWYDQGIRHEFLGGARGIIAQSMILFNKCTADFLHEHSVPYPAKVEEAPDSDGTRKIIAAAHQAGLSIPSDLKGEDLARNLLQSMRGNVDRGSYLRLLRDTVPRPYYDVSQGKGMFSLSVPGYAYATSPFRDYAALTTIRIMSAVLSDTRTLSDAQVQSIADEMNQFSEREDRVAQMLKHMDAIQDAGHARRSYSLV